MPNLKNNLSIIKNSQTKRKIDFKNLNINDIFINPFYSIFYDFKIKQYEKDINLNFEKRKKIMGKIRNITIWF